MLGEYNKNSANPLHKLFEVQRDTPTDAHLQAHHDGLHQGHRGHAEPVRVLEDVLPALVPPEYTTVIVAGDVKPEEVMPLVEKYWGDWKPARRYRRRSRRSRRPTGRSTRTCPGRATRCPG